MIRHSVLPSSVLHRGLLTGAAVTATLVLSACGGSSDSPSTGHGAMTTAPNSAAVGAATFNDADLAFTQHMIGHHQQAIQMAALADTRAASAEVKDLAAKIKAAQQPEIDTMHDWLTAWGSPAPMPSMSAASGMPGMGSDQMDMGSMPGAMSDADMTTLANAKGAAFDTTFLTMMIDHHEGAVQMAQQESSQGSNPDTVALAKKIITDQQAEITAMKGMLARG